LLSRLFHARRETVFKAWSSADHVKHWFSPETYTVPKAKVQMHAGGPFEVCMRSPTGEEHWTRGTFVEVSPHTRLVIDMHAMDKAGKPLFRAYTEVDFSDAFCGAVAICVGIDFGVISSKRRLSDHAARSIA
jgi:uncharacterized protein YndB with AHSA1/START domain